MKPKRLSIKKESVQPIKMDGPPIGDPNENPGKTVNRPIRRYERSGMPLSHDRAFDLYVRYNTEVKGLLESSRNQNLPNTPGFQGTEYVWISRKRLKLYMRFLKELEALNPDQPEITGVSLYFGRIGYEDDNVYEGSGDPQESGDEPEKIGDYRGRHTLFMAPTIRKEEIEGPEILKQKAFYVDSEFTEGFEKYIGKFEVLPFLEEVPFAGGGTEGGDPGDEGTSLLSNDLNNMPPMSS